MTPVTRDRDAARPVLDVSGLPTSAFGQRSLGWWATVGFMFIEGTTLAVAAASYLYLRQNYPTWPPPRTPQPDLLLPTVGMLLLLLTVAPMVRVAQAARRYDLRGIRLGLLAAQALSLVVLALRLYDFTALDVRWDSNAYGSAAWGVLGLHTGLLVVDAIETAAFAVLAFVGPLEKKHFSDFEDAAFYQYFLVGANVLVWLLLFVSPRWL